MAHQDVTLFDLPSQPPCKAWSLNPWKTRLLLNFKNIPYKTEWLEYPDIAARISPHLPPNESGSAYSIPTVLLPTGKYVMDSKIIAQELQSLYPTPHIDLASLYQAKMEDIMPRIMPALAPIYLPLIPKTLLNEQSRPYWYDTRGQFVGMEVDAFGKENGGEKAWGKVEPIVKEVTALLKENGDGPYFEGKQVTYADFVWGGFLLFLKRIGEGSYEELLKKSGDGGVHEALLKGLEQWTKRDT
ncbi:hypothetical protein QBC40DRAFT_7907 [Triangularia verruculosa]|uniref:GST N-terminal domain-containing protein n=1 Tax=Triangularia verruculosa TaxID=2587418 RepID=A0AAN6XUI2_9PEZI|nr:hypothetical protein QBC40DRAFT_7907 [Triangularia verruculosa]